MRFGIATIDITPTTPIPMYGYLARQDRFDGVHEPLTFTAVVIEEDGRRALLGAADLGMMPEDSTPALRQRLGEIVGCPTANIMLNASHTHGGPLVSTGSIVGPPLAQDVPAYEAWLCARVEAAATAAVAALEPGTLTLREGRTCVPLNRRLERDGQIAFAPDPNGPVDDRLFVFTLEDGAGSLRAVGIRVSCHPTGTGGKHLINGDFVGAWKRHFAESSGPDVVPFFLQGSGADAKPRQSARDGHWRGMEFAELPAVSRALNRELLDTLAAAPPRRLAPLLLAGHETPVRVPCAPRYTSRAAVEPMLQGNYEERLCAPEYLRRLDAGEPIPDHQDYLVQTLWLTADLALVGLDAEVLCGTGARIEAAAAPRQAICLGYTNGNRGYVPDRHEIARGGYERESFIFRGLSGPCAESMADQFAAAVHPPA